MAMVNMKMSREEAKEYNTIDSPDNAPQYPYGLCLDLNDDSLEKLGITSLPKVGTEMTITAKVVIKSVSAYDRMGGDAEQSVSMQITDMEIGNSQAERNNSAANALYGDD